MTDIELKSCIGTIEMLRRLHGVMNVIDAGNCEKIIKVLSDFPKYKDAYNKGWDDGAKASYEHLKMCEEEQEQSGDLISRDAVIDITWEEPSYTDALNVLTEVRDKVKALPSVKQEPCEKVAQERYADLCEYFGGTKDILKSRKNFKAWLERVKWHIRKAEELYEKYEYKKELCTDAVSRQAVFEQINCWIGSGEYRYTNATDYLNKRIKALQAVNPQEKTGHWISRYDEDAKEGWYECDSCHTERAFNTDYCPDCGCRMVEPQERSGREYG